MIPVRGGLFSTRSGNVAQRGHVSDQRDSSAAVSRYQCPQNERLLNEIQQKVQCLFPQGPHDLVPHVGHIPRWPLIPDPSIALLCALSLIAMGLTSKFLPLSFLLDEYPCNSPDLVHQTIVGQGSFYNIRFKPVSEANFYIGVVLGVISLRSVRSQFSSFLSLCLLVAKFPSSLANFVISFCIPHSNYTLTKNGNRLTQLNCDGMDSSSCTRQKDLLACTSVMDINDSRIWDAQLAAIIDGVLLVTTFGLVLLAYIYNVNSRTGEPQRFTRLIDAIDERRKLITIPDGGMPRDIALLKVDTMSYVKHELTLISQNSQVDADVKTSLGYLIRNLANESNYDNFKTMLNCNILFDFPILAVILVGSEAEPERHPHIGNVSSIIGYVNSNRGTSPTLLEVIGGKAMHSTRQSNGVQAPGVYKFAPIHIVLGVLAVVDRLMEELSKMENDEEHLTIRIEEELPAIITEEEQSIGREASNDFPAFHYPV